MLEDVGPAANTLVTREFLSELLSRARAIYRVPAIAVAIMNAQAVHLEVLAVARIVRRFTGSAKASLRRTLRGEAR